MHMCVYHGVLMCVTERVCTYSTYKCSSHVVVQIDMCNKVYCCL